MSDLAVMVERLREAQELEYLRLEVARLSAQWDDYAAVSSRSVQLGWQPYTGNRDFRYGMANPPWANVYGGSLLNILTGLSFP